MYIASSSSVLHVPLYKKLCSCTRAEQEKALPPLLLCQCLLLLCAARALVQEALG